MSEQQPFTTFIALVEFDQKTRSLVRQALDIEQKIADLHNQIIKTKSDQEKHQATIKEARMRIDEAELELKTRDQLIKEKRVQLDELTDHKQYQSLKREFDRLKKEAHEQEELLMSLWNNLEAVQKGYEEKNKEYVDALAVLEQEVTEAEQKRQQLETEKKHQEAVRSEKVAKVPEEWLELYNHMSMQTENPVVQVVDGSCDGCFYLIPPQDMVRLKRRGIVQCKGCFRLLFMKEAMDEAS